MDFLNALGQLLHDGPLRDAFAAEPVAVAERLGVQDADRARLTAMSPGDLEIQADVLLRKRFDAVKHLLARTLTGLGPRARQIFFHYARAHWPKGPRPALRDAADFCDYCNGDGHRGAIEQAELNRIKFVLGRKRFALCLTTNTIIRNRNRSGLQILIRHPQDPERWREFTVYLGL